MKKIKFLSALLALITVLGVVSATMVVPVAADEDEQAAAATDTAEANDASTETTDTGDSESTTDGEEETETDWLTKQYVSKSDMLQDMELRLTAKGYSLYVNPETCVVAVVDEESGQILTTNPYDIGTSTAADTVKMQLLSQIMLKYTDTTNNNTSVIMNSFTDAIEKDQFVIKNIKNGIRVEYSIGSVQTRRIAPRQISKESYENNIYANLSEEPALRFKGYYMLMDPDREGLTDADREEMYAKYPITETTAIYVLAEDVTERELNLIESFIKQDCPDYTYEVMMQDYAEIKYTATADKAPLFKMALEYKLTENGVDVRLAANGIRYDEDSYILDYIDILPMMGASTSDVDGYSFIPDGSGAIISNNTLGTANVTITCPIYGADYAYRSLSISGSQQNSALPVFGIISSVEDKTVTERSVVRMSAVQDETIGMTVASYKIITLKEDVKSQTDGFAAYITEGESLSSIVFEHSGLMHNYNYTFARVTIRPTDTYNLSEASSVGGDVSVTSKRKYTGSFRISYVILTDDKVAEKNGIEDYYPASYSGMAKAYREYLISEGVITQKTSENVKSDIPLYIEALGSINTTDTILTFPVTVKTPLTTFEDLKTITEELSEEGITNINYRLKGFANGGLDSTYPVKLKFVDKLGGNKGFTDFTEYAESKGIGVYPDFDFMYVSYTSTFDGFSFKKDAAKSIDNRYVSKKEYSYIYQSLQQLKATLVAPEAMERLYDKFEDKLVKLSSTTGISLSTLGSDLNSDFNKNNPYNRESAKGFVTDILAKAEETFGSVMVDGGNAYTLAYVDHVLNVTLDSTGYTYATGTVPFFGIVFHGTLDFAGSATNMAGNFDYELLKIIENGASPYFVLAYENTELLKENSEYAKYYSVSYDIWKEELVSSYKLLNENLADLQDDYILNHEFVIAERVASEEEIENDKITEAEEAEAKAISDAELEAEIDRQVNYEARMAAKKGEEFDADAYRAKLVEKYTGSTGSDEETQVDTSFVFDESKVTTNAFGETIYVRDDIIVEIKNYIDEDVVEYEYTKYTVDDNSVVKVTYSDGTIFYLNYNDFAVTVDGYTIEAFGFIKV